MVTNVASDVLAEVQLRLHPSFVHHVADVGQHLRDVMREMSEVLSAISEVLHVMV